MPLQGFQHIRNPYIREVEERTRFHARPLRSQNTALRTLRSSGRTAENHVLPDTIK